MLNNLFVWTNNISQPWFVGIGIDWKSPVCSLVHKSNQIPSPILSPKACPSRAGSVSFWVAFVLLPCTWHHLEMMPVHAPVHLHYFWVSSDFAHNMPKLPESDVGALGTCLSHFWALSSILGQCKCYLEGGGGVWDWTAWTLGGTVCEPSFVNLNQLGQALVPVQFCAHPYNSYLGFLITHCFGLCSVNQL